jgi:hypothetical protein
MRRWASIGGVAAALAVIAVAAGGAASGPLVLLPVSATVADLKAGTVTTELRNDSGRPAKNVRIRMSRVYSADGTPLCLEPGCVRTSIAKVKTIPAGAVRRIHVSLVGATTKKLGTYTGTIVAFRPATRTAVRTSVTIAMVPPTFPTPVADEVHATIVCRWPHGHGCHRATVDLPLTSAPAAGAKGPSGAVGAVSNGSRFGLVTAGAVTTTKLAATSRRAVPLTVSGLSHAGSYKGKADLTPTVAGGEVSVNAVVRDSLVWPVLILAAGVVVALLLKRITGIGRATAGLEQALRRAAIDFDRARLRSDTEKAGKPWHDYDPKPAGIAAGEKAEVAIDAARKGGFATPEEDKVKAAQAAIEELAAAAIDLDALTTSLPCLEDVLHSLETRQWKLPEIGTSTSGRPEIADDPSTKLTPAPPASVADIKAAAPDTRAATDLLREWQRLESDIAKLYADIEDHGGTGDDHPLAEARDKIKHAWSTLWNAAEADLVADGRAQDALDNAKKAWEDFIAEHPHRGPRLFLLEEPFTVTRGLQLDDSDRALFLARSPSVMRSMPPAFRPERLSPPASSLETDRLALRILSRRSLTRELLVGALGFILAVSTGFAALKLENGWGTWLDYFTAFAWGLGAGAALDLLLLPALEQLAKTRAIAAAVGR